MGEVVKEFAISIERIHDYEFRVRFDKEQMSELVTDEPAPFGGDAGPNPERLLAAAVGNCLSSSLLFCLRKARIDVAGLHTDVRVRILRNENKRLRVDGIEVTIDPELAEADREKARNCLSIFEDFCTVTQSVRAGIDVKVKVKGMDSGERIGVAPAS